MVFKRPEVMKVSPLPRPENALPDNYAKAMAYSAALDAFAAYYRGLIAAANSVDDRIKAPEGSFSPLKR
jgi:hypothetical protein